MLRKMDIIKSRKGNFYIVVDIDKSDPKTLYLSKYDNYYEQLEMPIKKQLDEKSIELVSKINPLALKIKFKFKEVERLLLSEIDSLNCSKIQTETITKDIQESLIGGDNYGTKKNDKS